MMKYKSKKNFLSDFLLLVVLLILASPVIFEFIFYNSKIISDNSENLLPRKNEFRKDLFANLNITAKAAVVLDGVTGQIIFAKNIDKQLPLASLTKIMTAIVALRSLGGDKNIVIDPKLVSVSDNLSITKGTWTLANLLKVSLTGSSNSGADNVAAAVRAKSGNFIGTMNNMAKIFGLKQTFFANSSGLDENPSFSGSYGSAIDTAHLLLLAAKNYPEIFYATHHAKVSENSLDGVKEIADNTNPYTSRIVGLVVSKTGLTDLAGGNLAMVIDVDFLHPIAIVVLGSTEDGRFQDGLELASTTMEYFNSYLN